MLSVFKNKKNSFDDLEKYEEDNYNYNDVINEYNEEPRIIESYPTEENYEYNVDLLNDETYDDEDYLNKEKKPKQNNKIKKIMNIVFCIVLILIVMVSIDIVCVSEYNKGPFFAIKTTTYKDGGTKVYYGLGYKVIKYHQVQGRRDMEIGTWGLSYNIEPIDIPDIDLSIEFETNYNETSKKYYKKFVRLSSTVKEVNNNNNELVLEYYDEDSKYTLWIYCNMADKDSNIDIYEKGDTVNVLGTIIKFKIKDKTNPNRVYLENCFAEYSNGAEFIEIE